MAMVSESFQSVQHEYSRQGLNHSQGETNRLQERTEEEETQYAKNRRAAVDCLARLVGPQLAQTSTGDAQSVS